MEIVQWKMSKLWHDALLVYDRTKTLRTATVWLRGLKSPWLFGLHRRPIEEVNVSHVIFIFHLFSQLCFSFPFLHEGQEYNSNGERPSHRVPTVLKLKYFKCVNNEWAHKILLKLPEQKYCTGHYLSIYLFYPVHLLNITLIKQFKVAHT